MARACIVFYDTLGSVCLSGGLAKVYALEVCFVESKHTCLNQHTIQAARPRQQMSELEGGIERAGAINYTLTGVLDAERVMSGRLVLRQETKVSMKAMKDRREGRECATRGHRVARAAELNRKEGGRGRVRNDEVVEEGRNHRETAKSSIDTNGALCQLLARTACRHSKAE